MAETLLRESEQRIADLQFNLKYLLEPIEAQRQELRKRAAIFWIIPFVLLLVTACIYWYYPHLSLSLILASVFIIISAVIYFFWIKTAQNELIQDFNKKIVPHFISEFLKDASFDADNYIDIHEYYSSDLFRRNSDRYCGESYVSGILGETSLSFSKLHSEYKTVTHTKNGGTRTTWHTIFKGIFLIADSNKYFQNSTYILPDTAERALGGIGRFLQEKFGSSGRGEMVYMENPDFEKRYVVYSTDPVEARYLLTPSMQQYFNELADHIGKDSVQASFINGKLYLALNGNFKLFDFKMSKPVTETETIKYYIKNLLDVLSVIEILDLNTRIWGK